LHQRFVSALLVDFTYLFGQILRYIVWVKKNLAPKVRGIIVTHSSDSNLEWAIEAIRDLVKLKFYKVKFELSDAS